MSNAEKREKVRTEKIKKLTAEALCGFTDLYDIPKIEQDALIIAKSLQGNKQFRYIVAACIYL